MLCVIRCYAHCECVYLRLYSVAHNAACGRTLSKESTTFRFFFCFSDLYNQLQTSWKKSYGFRLTTNIDNLLLFAGGQ